MILYYYWLAMLSRTNSSFDFPMQIPCEFHSLPFYFGHHSLHTLSLLSLFPIIPCIGLLASVSTSARSPFVVCLCNATFGTLNFVELGGSCNIACKKSSSSRFFDEKWCQKVFTSLPFSVCVFSAQIALLAYFYFSHSRCSGTEKELRLRWQIGNIAVEVMRETSLQPDRVVGVAITQD